MELNHKIALIYGGGGSLGGTVAKSLATAGAKLYLAGRTQSRLDKVANEIRSAGGLAETAIVDALDERSVGDFVCRVVEAEGKVDVSFNAIGWEDLQGAHLADMKAEDFMRPISIAMRSHFLTVSAAAKEMKKENSGVILFLTATPAGKPYAKVGGFGPACSATEAFSRNLAAELGPAGIRVVCIRSAGSPDSAVFMDAVKQQGELATMEIHRMAEDTMLKRLPLMQEIANVAAFLASDAATGMTGTTVNVTCGTTMD
jgi:NAD(P)-dependent dehydrogenase (short-subunit alcohol dehydrogenase family)